MGNLENSLIANSERKNLFKNLGAQDRIPFGTQYLEKPKVDRPGNVHEWKWQPSVPVYLGSETASWPGTTGTGPKAKEDERYGENG
ncbi:MAG: hypothetical protein AABW65_00990 [Nanoarchaeota archaeon]